MPLCRGGVQELQDSKAEFRRQESEFRSCGIRRLFEPLREIRGSSFSQALSDSSVPATYSSEFRLLILQLLNSCNSCNSFGKPKGQQESVEKSAGCPRNSNTPEKAGPDAIIAKLTEASYSRCVPRSGTGDRCTPAWRRGLGLRGCPREPRLPR
jgi:hypothetical protein